MRRSSTQKTTIPDLRKIQELPTRQSRGNPPGEWVRSKGLGILYLLFFLLTGMLGLKAQERSVVHTSQQWIQVYAQVELSEKLSIQADASIRQTHNGAWPAQRIMRAGLGYALPLKMRGATALARISAQASGHTSRHEWRIAQDLTRTEMFRRIQWQQRLRTEARFLKVRSNIGNEWQDHFNMRFCYRLQTIFPLAKFRGREHDPPQLMLNVSDELFVNAGREIIHNTLDNIRFVIGPSLRLNPNLSFALLYNHQYGHRSLRNTAESAEICWLTINWKGRWKASDKAGQLQ